MILSHPHLFQVAQHALVKNSAGGALILKNRKSGRWILPGGVMQVGEHWYEAFARTLKEAAGIVEFTIRDILEVDSWDEHGETFYAVMFACEVPDFQALVLSKEHLDFAWVSQDELDQYDFEHPEIKRRLLRFLANVPPPTSR